MLSIIRSPHMPYHMKSLKNGSIFIFKYFCSVTIVFLIVGWQLHTSSGRCDTNDVDSGFITTIYYQIDWAQFYSIWSVVNVFDIIIHQFKYLYFNYLNSTMEALREKLGIGFDMILARHDGQAGDELWVNIHSLMQRAQVLCPHCLRK